MFSYKIHLYENTTWVSLQSWARPFTDGTRLDDTLDAGCINLKSTKRSKAIKPFTKLRIIISENGKEVDRIYRLVASSKRTRRSYAPSTGALYDWTINTIELTKLLERRFIGTMTSTMYLHANVATQYLPAKYTVDESEGADFGVLKSYYTPVAQGETYNLINPNIQFEFEHENSDIIESYVKAYESDGTLIADISTTKSGNVQFVDTVLFSKTGNAKIEVYVYYEWISGNQSFTRKVTYIFTIPIIEQGRRGEKSYPTITSVCQRLLSAGITRRKGLDKQEFTLDTNFAKEYEDMTSPEFSFTNCTLFDALLQVGGYIHAIPRLVPNGDDDTHYVVTFDKLGGNELAPNLPKMIYQDHSIAVDDWCGTVDSPAQNLCDTVSGYAGTVREFGDDYITVRTEEGQVELNADNAIVLLSMPIEKVVKVECGFISEYDNGETAVGDISAYVYEEAEYQTLSSYWGTAYPYSKAWALCYAKGDNKITGLSNVQKDSTSTGTAFNNYAIVNIINAVTGLSLNDVDGEFMRKLAFRVTYVPVVTARVQAVKPLMDDGGEVKNQLVYNQGANVAETTFYGEKMKGAIARLGQDTEMRTYDLFTYSQLPKCGQLLDGKYISAVDTEYDITKLRATLTLTKNFNQLSQFVGLNSNYRLYDISEKQSVERHVHYSEIISVGDKPVINTDANSLIKNIYAMVYGTVNPLQGALIVGNDAYPRKVTVAGLIFDSDFMDTTKSILAPVSSFGFGNSICFAVQMYDNYGAGFQIQSDGYESEKNKAVQRLVPYVDAYGDADTVYFSMGAKAWDADLSVQSDGGFAQLYPDGVFDGSNAYIACEQSNPLIIEKDNREHLYFCYQAHFQSTRESVFVGSGMANKNPLVSGTNLIESGEYTNTNGRIFWLSKPINGLNRFLDTSDADVIEVERLSGSILADLPILQDDDGVAYWHSRKNPTDKTIYAYAVCRPKLDSDDGLTAFEILFGENFENGLAPNEMTPPIYFALYPKDVETLYAKAGTIVYATAQGTAIGVLQSVRNVEAQPYAEYSPITNAMINRYGYRYTETFVKSEIVSNTITLAYKYDSKSLRLYADDTLLASGSEYEIQSDGSIIILSTPPGTENIIANYIVAETTHEVVNGYVKTNDLSTAV